ncbi:kelch-like protein 12 isoform X2 [Arctopsyche grandis]
MVKPPEIASPCEEAVINSKHALRILKKMNEDQSVYDVILCIKGEELPAHKIVLAAASQYFYTMFTCGMKESQERFVEFDDTSMETMKKIVNYIYNGTLDVTDDTVESLLQAAYLFQLEDVIDKCCERLKENLALNNCIGIMVMADLHNLVDLKITALDFVNENFLNVFQQEEFMKLTIEQLSTILNSQNIAVEAEEQIFICITTWIDFKKSEREKHLLRLLKLVKIPLITPKFISNQIKGYCRSSPECMDVIMESYESRLIPDNSQLMPSPRPLPKYSLEKVVIVCDFGREKLDIKRLDPIANSWSYCASLDYRKSEFGVAAIEDGKIIVLGGLISGAPTDTVECIDLKTTCTFELSPMPKSCHNFEAISIGEGSSLAVYAVGGQNGNETLNTVQKWSSSIQVWSLVASMNHKRQRFGLAVLNDKLYAAGGWSDSNTLQNVEAYNQKTDKWSDCPPMNEKRRSFGMTAVGGCIYAVGGLNDDGKTLSTVEKFDPKTGLWSFVKDMPSGRQGARAVGLTNGNLIVFDGSDSSLEILRYLPELDEWKQIAPINEAYHSIGAVLVI